MFLAREINFPILNRTSEKLNELKDKIAVVTDGTKSIGYVITQSLLKAGASVFIFARNKLVLKQSENFGLKLDERYCHFKTEWLS